MGAYVVAAVYATVSIVAAYVISLDKAVPYRWIFVGWLAFIIPNFALRSPMLGLFVGALILLALPKKSSIERVILYVGMFAAMPDSFDFLVPFPGINHLIPWDYPKTAFLILLLPIILRGQPGRLATDQRMILAAFAAYLAVVIILNIREFPLTTALRVGANELFLIAPAVALSWAIRSPEDMDRCLRAITVLAILLASISIVSQAVRWNFYIMESLHDYRFGLLRTSVTANTTTTGLICGIGLLNIMLYLRDRFSKMLLFLAASVCAAGLLFTFSRGAWLATIAAFIIYKLSVSRISSSFMIAIIIALAVSTYLFLTTTTSEIDAFGTFSYRAEILKASVKQFWTAPFFGSPDFLSSGNFDHLVQGQGIVDIVNMYAQLLLLYGLTGTLLFFIPFIITIFEMFRIRNRSHRVSNMIEIQLKKMMGVMLASITAYLVLVATTSNVSYTLHIGYLLLGLGMALARFSALKERRHQERPSRLLEPST